MELWSFSSEKYGHVPYVILVSQRNSVDDKVRRFQLWWYLMRGLRLVLRSFGYLCLLTFLDHSKYNKYIYMNRRWLLFQRVMESNSSIVSLIVWLCTRIVLDDKLDVCEFDFYLVCFVKPRFGILFEWEYVVVILLSSYRIGIWSLGWIDGCGGSQYSLYGSRISINCSCYLWMMSLPYLLFWIWCDSYAVVFKAIK